MSRNAASSRAVPTKEFRRRIITDPVVPVEFGVNRKGMQATEQLEGSQLFLVKQLWLSARWPAVFFHYLLTDLLHLHKQVANRLLEPWAWADVVVSGTEWKNFFYLRANPAAQPEFRTAATLMKTAYDNNVPSVLYSGDWHLPYVTIDERKLYSVEQLRYISAARCARVSYYLREGGLSSSDKDIAMCEKLLKDKHASPFEHVACATKELTRYGNYVGWRQWRKDFENESNGDYIEEVISK